MIIRENFKHLLKSRPYRIIKRTLLILLFLWWLLLSHVTFSVRPEENTKYVCSIDKYQIAVASPLPINPSGLWFSLRYFFDEPYYLVVYDNQGHYIGQSWPALHSDIYNGIRSKVGACYGLEIENDTLVIFSDDDVNIPLHHKQWWSWILQFIYMIVPGWILKFPVLIRDYVLEFKDISIRTLISVLPSPEI